MPIDSKKVPARFINTSMNIRSAPREMSNKGSSPSRRKFNAAKAGTDGVSFYSRYSCRS